MAVMEVTITDSWVSLWWHEKILVLEEHHMYTIHQTEYRNIRSAVNGKESTNFACLAELIACS